MNALELLESLPVMLWTAAEDGVWTHVNQRWATYTGLAGDAPGAGVEFGFEPALHPEDVAPTVARWRQAVQTGQPYRAEYRLRRSDGQYRWHLTQGVLAQHPDPDVVWSGACLDIHDQRLAEQATRRAQESAVRALGLVLEARDHETKGHTDRVTSLASRLGAAAGLSAEALQTLRLGAYLHDIGKVAVPDAILQKPGPLTPAERQTMQAHVASGERFAASLDFLDQGVLDVIRGHHERWDGAGYPAGQQADEIPLLARIFALADVYDALVSERPYKPAWSEPQALATIAAEGGHHFDPHLTALFLDLMRGTPPAQASPRSDRPGPDRLDPAVQALALHEAEVSVLITDADQRLLYVNPAFSRVSGYAPEEVLGRNPRFLQGPGTSPDDRRALREALAAGQSVHQLILNYTKAGQELWFEMQVTPIYRRGTLHYFVAVQTDRSAQVADQQRLHWSATHDALTGLLNRFSLHQCLTAALAPSVFVLLDLNNLKGINDQGGHQAGDQALQAVAALLRTQMPAGAAAYRLGGDEFLLILPQQGPAATRAVVEQLRQGLAEQYPAGSSTALSGSFGTADYPEDGADGWAVLGVADERMYEEKLGQPAHRPSVRRRRPRRGGEDR